MGLWNHSLNSDESYTFSLEYGYEAVLPLGIQISSLRVTLATRMTMEEK